MQIKTSLTGSFPPVYNPYQPIRNKSIEEQDKLVFASIKRAISAELEAGIDVLVDGQTRDDIVSSFCRYLPGFSGDTLPYRVVGPIQPAENPITVKDYHYALEVAKGAPVKAHLTGPMTLARDAIVIPASGYTGKTDPRLVKDIAHALGFEARLLIQAGAKIIQIDEPVLRNGVDLELAFSAMRKIVEIGEIPQTGLHICGNTSRIIKEVLTSAPVDYVSMEGAWLKHESLSFINNNFLKNCKKQIGLGCIEVADYTVERLRSVEATVDQMVNRLGIENIWAITPNCGMRLMPYEVALKKIQVMCEAAHSIMVAYQ